jgi:LPS-assembly lipoprotein
MSKLIAITLTVVSLMLAGCTNVRPLYGTGPDGASVGDKLSGISVQEQGDRAGQIVRNNLISSFGSSGSEAYQLQLQVTERTQNISARTDIKLWRYRYRLTAKFILIDPQTRKTVKTGWSFSTVSYDTVEQPIADLRATEEARERAGREVAEDIRLRLAAHFAAAQ